MDTLPQPAIVMYHDNCCDGFTAAWLAYRNLPSCEFIPVNYNQDHLRHREKIRGRRVYVFDFSFPRDIMEEFNSICTVFQVHDHHETGERDCDGLPYCHFDRTKSGAMLAWDTINGDDEIPFPIVKYVQDYDLWKFELPDSKAINAYIHSQEKTFDRWEIIHNQLLTTDGMVEICRMGNFILQLEAGAVKGTIKHFSTVIIGGVRVPLINNPNLISKTVGALAKDRPFAAAFFMRQDGKFVFSLRSTAESGTNVAEIAEKYPGGGGHKQAAGFTISMNEFTLIWDTLEYTDGTGATRKG